MIDFFASLYEWFGLMSFYSSDMGDLLRGWDETCTDYSGTPWYSIIGWIFIILTSLFYAFQYHILDSSQWNKMRHWWIFALLILGLNFVIAFSITFNIFNSEEYCNVLNINISDCIGFGISNAIWSLLLFMIITSIPIIRKHSTNCRFTTFWGPK